MDAVRSCIKLPSYSAVLDGQHVLAAAVVGHAAFFSLHPSVLQAAFLAAHFSLSAFVHAAFLAAVHAFVCAEHVTGFSSAFLSPGQKPQ
jgi:hypothetical protein